ncbi:replication initiation negative regulator SeqA [Shewanella aestuarii]|uniref:Negative modulator of initiation of replication n=1 Tax=Shewanella aestuarii TaxID=1028752 RepID=A0A6G9QL08_9GAMM|nr:replication initiation negative regulator SeqA [Shewanella aestuarii]QIR14549.1 replication initiation negative regulator SeqA [Shewanella aestuarii]
MKYIEIDEELYRFIAGKTERIGESASEILRRLLNLPVEQVDEQRPEAISQPGFDALDANAREALFNKAKNIVEQLVTHRPKTLSVTNSEVLEPQVAQTSVPQSVSELKSIDSPLPEFNFDDLKDKKLISEQKGAVGRFMFLLSGLANLVGNDFNQVLKIQGKGRLYFACSKQELLDASQSANPKQIGSSGYWVTTNNNTAKKKRILTEALVLLGCDTEKAQSIANFI